MDTKSRIMETALELFAEKGYEGASMQDIAGRLNLTKGALYRHFTGKRAILDAILERMAEQDRQKARESDVPEDEPEQAGDAYAETTLQDIRSFSLAMFDYWTGSGFACRFRRMLALQRYSSPEMMAHYRNYLSSGPLNYMTELFSQMAIAHAWQASEARCMALEFYGPMYLLISEADAASDPAQLRLELEAHIDRFIEKYGSGKD